MSKTYSIQAALRALSDETRLRMLALVLQQECCVCEVTQALDISQTRASRNLGILEDAGFLKSRREGKWMYYSLRDELGNTSVAMLLEVTKYFSRTSPTCRQDKKRLKKAIKMGHNCVSNKNN